MYIDRKYLPKNHMTRCGEKIKKVKYIIVHSGLNKNLNVDFDVEKEYEYIINLSKQDEIYYSAHYIIGKDGKCVQIIPEDEIAYSTMNIDLNYYAISIECCAKRKDGQFSDKTIDKLVKILSYLKEKYNIPKNNILLHYDLTGTRCPKYYVDNKFKFLDILENI